MCVNTINANQFFVFFDLILYCFLMMLPISIIFARIKMNKPTHPRVICSNFVSLSVIECYYCYKIYTANDFDCPNLYIWIKLYCLIIRYLSHCLVLGCVSIWQGHVYRIYNSSWITLKRHSLELYFRWHVSPHLLCRPLKGDLVILNSMPFPKRDLFKCGAYPVTTVISR